MTVTTDEIVNSGEVTDAGPTILDVSRSMKDLLVARFKAEGQPVEIDFEKPAAGWSGPRVSLYPYSVADNPALNNLGVQPVPSQPGKVSPLPMSLNVRYLLTAYGEPRDTQAQVLLSSAMRFLYDDPDLSDYLVASLHNPRQHLRVVLLGSDEVSHFWHMTGGVGFTLAAAYEVSVLILRPPERRHDVANRVERVGVPTVTTFQPPAIVAIDPPRGTTGSYVRLVGKDIVGWKVAVEVQGTVVIPEADGEDLVIKIPDDFPLGRFSVTVNIEDRFWRSFIYEVVEGPS